MSKTKASQLAEETLEELTTFLRAGTINEGEVARSLSFSGLDIDDLDRLKRIHFVMSEDVVEYVRKLPQRLRRIKRENRRRKEVGRHIDGKIDWQQTTKIRYSDSYGDKSLFAYESPNLEYDLPENLVLKKLLSLIYITVKEDIKKLDYPWREGLWNDELITEIEQIFEKNVHLGRIRDARDIQLTGRELNAARKSRKVLYKRSYQLYTKYEKLLENELDDEVQDILLESLIVPNDTHKLFELFSVFKMINYLNSHPGNELKLQPIEKEAKEIAVMESEEKEVRVYHDRQGNLEFYENLQDTDDVNVPYLQRYKEATLSHKNAVGSFIGSDSHPALYSGRPDIVIEKYNLDRNDKKLVEVILGEIKYTQNQQTFSEGLKELIEYIKYARKGPDYIDEIDVVYRGLVITDGVKTDRESWNKIRHLTTNDLMNDNVLLDDKQV